MAMAEVPDRGNPNFFTLFNGSHVAELVGSASTSNVFMLTSMNAVQFLGDCTAGADGRMWVLPEECRPRNPVRFMCPIEPTGDVPGASYEVVVDVTAESKAVEVVTGIATETSKALTQATLSTETANAVDGVEMATNQVRNLVSSPSTMVGAGLTAGQYDGLVGATALSSATMTQTKVEVLSGVSLQTAEGEVLSGAGLQTAEGDFLVSATAVSGSIDVTGMPNAKKATIKVPDTPGSTFAVVTVMPDGTISGEPGVLHYTNGHMFNISDNWYLE